MRELTIVHAALKIEGDNTHAMHPKELNVIPHPGRPLVALKIKRTFKGFR